MTQIVKGKGGKRYKFPDDATPDEIRDALDSLGVRVSLVKAHVRGPRGAVKKVADLLPVAGGVAGGVVGGAAGAPAGGVGALPGAMAGAGIGGAGGEAVRQLLYRAAGIEGAPETAKEAALRVVNEGATQGVLEAVGGGLAQAAKGAGQLAVRAGLKVPFETASSAIAHRITATRQGLVTALKKIGAQDLITRRHLARAEMKGVEFDGLHIAMNALDKIKSTVAGRKHAIDDANEAVQLALKFMQNHPGKIKPVIAHRVQQSLEQSTPLQSFFRKVLKSEPTTGGSQVEALWDKALKESLEDALNTGVEGYQASNAVTSDLIKVKNAVAATKPARNVPLAARLAQRVAAPAAGGAVAGAVFGEQTGRLKGAAYGAGLGAGAALFGSPSALTRFGVFADNPALAAALTQFPRTIEYAARPKK